MKTRPIDISEIEAGKTASGGFSARQLRAWGVSWPPVSGWRKHILKFGVPASCPMPAGFCVEEDIAHELPTALDPHPQREATLDPELSSPLSDIIEIYTDGSFAPHLVAGGWAFATFLDADEIHADFGGKVSTTNNRMELQAIIQALTWLDFLQPALVWSDSQYAVHGCDPSRHGWRRDSWTRRRGKVLANADLWQDLDGLLHGRPVEVRWTRGHAGRIGNERADELALKGALMRAQSPGLDLGCRPSHVRGRRSSGPRNWRGE